MASSYSPTLRLELIGTGEQSGIWGDTTNSNLGSLLEQAITGVQNIPISDDDYTLTALNGAVDQARNAVLVITSILSLTATRNIIIPSAEKLYIVKNSTTGGQSIVVKTAGGVGYTIPAGQTALVYCDGTNVSGGTDYSVSFSTPSLTATNATVVNLTATNLTLQNDLAVTHGGTGASDAATAQANLNVPSRTGSGASGTWPISVSGSAVSATTQAKAAADTTIATTAFSKNLFVAPTVSGVLDWNDTTNTIPGVGTTLLLGDAANGPGTSQYFLPFNMAFSQNDGLGSTTQMAVAYGDVGNDLYMRGRYEASWTGWVRYLNSGNFNSYAPTLTGTGATGTWNIGISGNAATATNATNATNATTTVNLNGGYVNATNGVFSGSVGINTAAISALTVNGGIMINSIPGTGGAKFFGYYLNDTNYNAINSDGNGSLIFETGVSGVAQRMFITNAGRVGVSQPNPGALFEVNGGILAKAGAPVAGGLSHGFSFGGDGDTGMFSFGGGDLRLYSNNNVRQITTANTQLFSNLATEGVNAWAQRTLLVEHSGGSQPGIGFHAPASSSAGIFKFYGPASRFECRAANDAAFVTLGVGGLEMSGYSAYACRAWVVFGASGNIANQGAVSAVGRNGVGDYTVYFSYTLATPNYGVVSTPTGDGGSVQSLFPFSGQYTQTSLRVLCRGIAGGSSIANDFPTVATVACYY